MALVALLMAVGFAFAAAAFTTYALLTGRVRTLAVRALGMRVAEASAIPSLWFRMAYPLLVRLGPLFRRLHWPRYRTRASVELQRSGVGTVMTVDHLLAMKALCALLTPLLASRVFELLTNPALFVLVGIGGFLLPDRLLRDLRRHREGQIVRTLPGTVDVLSLSVEAGLEFLMAIQRVVERGAPSPLRDELATVLNDVRLGKGRSDALKAFSSRVEIPEVSSFVSVLVQADMLGASIGPVLQSQAERMRVERFQRAEKAGARATQKILIPLVLFIFPAVLIVILGPVALQFVYGR